MNLLEKCNRVSPVLCRLAAAPATTRQIAQRAGLTKSTVHVISLKTTWNDVSMEVAERFSQACGVNLLASKRARQRLCARSWKFLKRVKPAQRSLIQRLLESIKAA